MKKLKKGNKQGLKDRLKHRILCNDDALDYIKNEICRMEGLLKFNPEDKDIISYLNILNYIEFSLEFLGYVYEKGLKQVGGVI